MSEKPASLSDRKIDPIKIVCLTPIKNEAWILETFLQCASVWADHIIVADQMSDDGSREIVSRFEKAILVDNNCPTYDEKERSRLLLSEARKIPGRKVLIALDADEILAGDLKALRSEAFRTIPEGTQLAFDWVNVHSSYRKFWNANPPMPWGFVDDGTPHTGRLIHSGRVPEPEGSPLFVMKDVQVLHLQYAHWERMRSKHRWYECFERLNYPTKSGISMYRQYHHMDAIPGKAFQPIKDSHLQEYRDHGIDPFGYHKSDSYWWDAEVLAMLSKYGTIRFRDIDIWTVDWNELAETIQFENSGNFTDPRGPALKMLAKYLRFTQPFHSNILVKICDKTLKVLFRPVRAQSGQAQ